MTKTRHVAILDRRATRVLYTREYDKLNSIIIIDSSVSIEVIFDHKTPLSCLSVARGKIGRHLTTYAVEFFISGVLRRAK